VGGLGVGLNPDNLALKTVIRGKFYSFASGTMPA
jgi:hypothetical protein